MLFIKLLGISSVEVMSNTEEHLEGLLNNTFEEKINWLTHYQELEEAIKRIWNPERGFTFFQGPVNPPWTFGIADSFRKSIKGLDRKLQGRILEAVMKICESPLNPVGDTLKPLSGELQGFWRYRIGDHRLIYRPDKEEGKVLLLEFGPRGDIYE